MQFKGSRSRLEKRYVDTRQGVFGKSFVDKRLVLLYLVLIVGVNDQSMINQFVDVLTARDKYCQHYTRVL